MRKFKLTWFLICTAVSILFWAEMASGSTTGPRARSVTFSAGKYVGTQFDPFMQYALPPYSLLPDREKLQHMTQITADFDLSCVGDSYYRPTDACIYLDNSVFAKSTQRQYRYVAWEFEIGLAMHNVVDIFYHHRSEHMLDTSRPYHFPLANYIGVRIEFIPDARRLLRYRR